MESREFDKQVHKNKYQIPNIDELVDGISQIIAEIKAGNVYFTRLDFTYANGQVYLKQKTSEQGIFEEKILKKLDVSNVSLKLRKCEFAKNRV